MIRLDHVHKSFGRIQALEAVNVEASAGMVTALLGPNGAGKTTAMRLMTGSISPDAGRVEVAGRVDPRSDSAARAQIGFLAETASIYPEMTPAEYLAYRGRLYGLDRRSRRAGVYREIERCELGDVRRKRVGALSKGYRQRVGLAAALLHDPSVLVLDEPTSGLDPEQIRAFRGLVAGLAREKTVVLSSHVLAEIEAVAGRVVVLARGRVVHDGEFEFRSDPRTVCVECRASDEVDAETDLARVAGMIVALEGVIDCSSRPSEPGWHRLEVRCEHDLRESVAGVLVRAGRSIREMAPVRVSLEERFASLVREGAGS